MAAYILTGSRPLSARWRRVASSRSPSAQACRRKVKANQGDNKGKNKRKPLSALLFFRGTPRGRAWREKVAAPHLRHPAPQPPPPSPLPFLCPPRVPTLMLRSARRPEPGEESPHTHTCGGEEVQHRLATSHVGQEVPDREPILSTPPLLPYLCPQYLLLGLPAGAVLEHVVPRLSPVEHHQHLAVGSFLVHSRY